jgi:hypothetical protein
MSQTAIFWPMIAHVVLVYAILILLAIRLALDASKRTKRPAEHWLRRPFTANRKV